MKLHYLLMVFGRKKDIVRHITDCKLCGTKKMLYKRHQDFLFFFWTDRNKICPLPPPEV